MTAQVKESKSEIYFVANRRTLSTFWVVLWLVQVSIVARLVEVSIEVTSDDEKDWDVGLCGALVEVDWADGDHAEGDDDGDAARDRAPDCAQQQQQKFHQKVNEISRGLKEIENNTVCQWFVVWFNDFLKESRFKV